MKIVRKGNIDRAQELIPAAKYFLFRHRELMRAGELFSLRNNINLADGSMLRIISVGREDTVEIIGAAKPIEKRPEAEEMIVPENALIWTGLANQQQFPPAYFANLSKWWTSTVIPAPELPTNEMFDRRLLYIHAPTRPLSNREVQDVLLWLDKVPVAKIVIQNAYDDPSIVSNINIILEQIGSPLRLKQIYSNLVRNYDYYDPGTDPWDDLPNAYSGATSLWRFNDLTGSFLSRGINYTVGIAAEALDPEVEGNLRYMSDPEVVSGEQVPVLASGPVGLYARIWVGWPWKCTGTWAGQPARPKYWWVPDTGWPGDPPTFDWEAGQVDEIQSLWNPDFGLPEGWQAAYHA